MNVDDRSPDSTSELTTAVALPDALATYEDEVAAIIDGGVKQKGCSNRTAIQEKSCWGIDNRKGGKGCW